MYDFSILGPLPTVEAVQEGRNAEYDKVFHYDKNGDRHALVCTFCHEFLLCEQEYNFYPIDDLEKKRHIFTWDQYVTDVNELVVIQPLVKAYKFTNSENGLAGCNWIKGLC
jgi:hypothetical protein